MSETTPNPTLETPQGAAPNAPTNAPFDQDTNADEGAEAIAAALSAPTQPGVSAPDEDHQDSAPPAEPVAADVSAGGGQPTAPADDRSAVLTAWKAKLGLTPEGDAPPGEAPAPAPEAKAPTTPATPTPPKAPAKPAGDAPAGKIDLKATRDFFREEFGEGEAAAKIDPLLKVIEDQQAKLDEVNTFITEQRTQAQAAQRAQLEAYDRAVNTFLDKEIVGKYPDADRILGTSDKADDLHKEARQVLHTRAVQIMSENIQSRKVNPKLEPLAPEDALRKAAESLFGGPAAKPQSKAQARKEIESSITKRHNARLPVPTSAPAVGGGQEEDPRQAGIDAIAAELARG